MHPYVGMFWDWVVHVETWLTYAWNKIDLYAWDIIVFIIDYCLEYDTLNIIQIQREAILKEDS